MRRAIIALSLVPVLMLLSIDAACDAGQTYKHPTLGFQFTATPGLKHVPRPGDEGTYEVMDPESDIHVMLWCTTTEQDARRYLWKMADMMGLVSDEKPLRVRISGHNAWMFDVAGSVNNEPAHVLLATIQYGMSTKHPRENALYIAQIWCPEEKYDENKEEMQEILTGIEIIDPIYITHGKVQYALYPELLDAAPEVPSPQTTKDGMEIVTCLTLDGRYCLIPVTIENGEPLDYKNNIWFEKGRQLDVDAEDFPTLARTGLHSEEELERTTSITGRPVEEITRIARPQQYSGIGFMGYDEDIISVLKGDNRLVERLGSTHPQIAEPLFHVFNLIITVKKDSERGNVRGILYNGREIYLKFWGAKGWQESIFDDEILGYWEIEMWRALDDKEKAFLSERYPDLSEEQMSELKKKISYIHTGEMVPFYIMRYGFYEGHTGYRADPIAVSFIFGLSSLVEIEEAFEGALYETLTDHFAR
jgi:hypothetical protein